MERKVGEVFGNEEIALWKVVESPYNEQCHFYGGKHVCLDYNEYGGECWNKHRKDKKDVIFKKIK